MKKYNIISIVIGIITLIITLTLHLACHDVTILSHSIDLVVILPIALAVYLFVSFPYLIKAYKRIIKGDIFNEVTLTLIATIAAFAIGEYIEGLAVIVFFRIGEYIEDIGYDKSKDSVKSVLSMRPDSVTLYKDGIETTVDPYDVNIGDLFIVKPGERIPLDGVIIEGNSNLDTSSMTGESLPKKVAPGDKIISGVINSSSPLIIKSTTTFYNSTLSKVLEMVENATNTKTKEEKFISKFAHFYTPIVVALAFLVAIIPPLFLGISNTSVSSTWIYRGATFLVVSCPCSLIISVPMAFFVGIGQASKFKALIKGSVYIEKLNKLDTLVLDKTGTVTMGNFEVYKTIQNNKNYNMLELALAGEYYSNHPIALAIKRKASNISLSSSSITDYTQVDGMGIKLNYNNLPLYVGNDKLMNKFNLDYIKADEIGTIIYINYDNKFIGSIIIKDLIKPSSKLAISEFYKNKINNVYMLTGDNISIANDVAKEVNINHVYADLLPNEKGEKLEVILKNKSKKSVVGFVGDGVNDALSLKLADLGISMGALGSDAAIEASDVVLLNDDLNTINIIKKLANRTLFVAYENIIFSILIKVLVMVLSVSGVLGNFGMWFAIFGDVGVTFLCVINSLRLMLFKPKQSKK